MTRSLPLAAPGRSATGSAANSKFNLKSNFKPEFELELEKLNLDPTRSHAVVAARRPAAGEPASGSDSDSECVTLRAGQDQDHSLMKRASDRSESTFEGQALKFKLKPASEWHRQYRDPP